MDPEKSIHKHLLIDDVHIGSVPNAMKLKVGAYLTNLMCKTLKFRCGNNKFMLLKPQVQTSNKKTVGSLSRGPTSKHIGFISYNKAFVEEFI